MNDSDKGIMQNVYFTKSSLDSYRYVERLANEKYDGNFSSAIRQIVREHRANNDRNRRIDGLQGFSLQQKEEIKRQLFG